MTKASLDRRHFLQATTALAVAGPFATAARADDVRPIQIGLLTPLTGVVAAGGREIVEGFQGNAYRAVYTVRFADIVYVLHAFQKKSPHGIKTAQPDIELIHQRLKAAQADYESRYGKRGRV
jgi:phage-related protein